VGYGSRRRIARMRSGAARLTESRTTMRLKRRGRTRAHEGHPPGQCFGRELHAGHEHVQLQLQLARKPGPRGCPEHRPAERRWPKGATGPAERARSNFGESWSAYRWTSWSASSSERVGSSRAASSAIHSARRSIARR
jgi:hypothetical protein